MVESWGTLSPSFAPV
jgi:hypothetical protein